MIRDGLIREERTAQSSGNERQLFPGPGWIRAIDQTLVLMHSAEQSRRRPADSHQDRLALGNAVMDYEYRLARFDIDRNLKTNQVGPGIKQCGPFAVQRHADLRARDLARA